MANSVRIKTKDGSTTEYVLKVCLVNTHSSLEEPRILTLMRDDETIELHGGEEFITVLVPKGVLHAD